MIKTVRTVVEYRCSKCKAIHETEEAAQKCERKDTERARQDAALAKAADVVRLSIESIDDVPRLIEENARKVGIILKIDFWPTNLVQASNSHNCPISGKTNWSKQQEGLPISYLGWSGQWRGKIERFPRRLHDQFSDGLEEVFNLCARGFYTGTGCPGKEFNISGGFWLDDCPKLLKKHEEMVALQAKRDAKKERAGELREKYDSALEGRMGLELKELMAQEEEIQNLISARKRIVTMDFEKRNGKEFPTEKKYDYDEKLLDKLQKELLNAT